MKKVLVSLFLSLCLLSAHADGNTNSVSAEVKQMASTNLNAVMIEILSGVKDAGKEIYGASKDAIRTSITFVQQQAPEVVEQFVKWKFCEALTYSIITFVLCVLCIFWFCFSIHKLNDNANSDYCFLMVLTVFFSIITFCICLKSSMDVLKIKVAPKVYLIEYVVNLAKGDGNRR